MLKPRQLHVMLQWVLFLHKFDYELWTVRVDMPEWVLSVAG